MNKCAVAIGILHSSWNVNAINMRNDRRKSGSYRHGVTNDLTRQRNIDVTNPSEVGNYTMHPIKNLKFSRTHKLSSSKISCSNGSTLTKVLLNTDEYPSETMWHIYEATSSDVVKVGSYKSPNNFYLESFCLEFGKCYSFVISDSSSNGICCGEGHGSYQLYYGGILVQEGSNFISSETSLPFGSCSTSNLPSTTPSNNPTISAKNSLLQPLRLTSFRPVPTSQGPTNQDTSYLTSSTSPPSPSTSTSAYPTINGCPNTETLVHITLTTDKYAYETVWNIKEKTSHKKVKKYDFYNDGNKVHKHTFCLNTNACYVFEITDSYGDGICCNSGNGSYQLYYDDILVQEGGSFTDSETSPPFGSCSTSNLPSATPSSDITKNPPSQPPTTVPSSRLSFAPSSVPSSNPSAFPTTSRPQISIIIQSKDSFESKSRAQPYDWVVMSAGVVIFLWVIYFTGMLWLKRKRQKMDNIHTDSEMHDSDHLYKTKD